MIKRFKITGVSKKFKGVQKVSKERAMKILKAKFPEYFD